MMIPYRSLCKSSLGIIFFCCLLMPTALSAHHGWGWATGEEFEITGVIVEVLAVGTELLLGQITRLRQGRGRGVQHQEGVPPLGRRRRGQLSVAERAGSALADDDDDLGQLGAARLYSSGGNISTGVLARNASSDVSTPFSLVQTDDP